MTSATTPTAELRGGRPVAWAGLALGGALSVAANVQAAWLPAAQQAPGWTPPLGAQLAAGAWPLALLLAVEVLSRVRWPSGVVWLLLRFGGVGIVGAGAAVISYGHVYAVLFAWGYGVLGSGVGPLTIDGLTVVCGCALVAMGRPVAVAEDVAADQVNRDADRIDQVDRPAGPRTVRALVDAGPAPDHSARPVLVAAGRTADDLHQTTPDHGPTGPDHSPDPLLDRVAEWAAEQDTPPTARAIRSTFNVGADRGKRLHDQLAGRVVRAG